MNSIKADFYRGLRSKSTYISLGILVVTLAFVASMFLIMINMIDTVTVYTEDGVIITDGTNNGVEFKDSDGNGLTQEDYDEMVNDIDEVGLTDGKSMAEMSTSMGQIGLYFIIPFIILFFGIDFSSQTINNVLSRGRSRTKYYLLKFVPLLICAIIIQILAVLVPTLIMGIGVGFGSGYTLGWFLSMLKVNAIEVLLVMAMASCGMMFTVITKKTGGIVGLCIALTMVPEIVIQLLTIAFPDAAVASKYTLLNSMDISIASTSGDLLRSILVAIGYIVVSTAIGLTVFKKSNIK